MNGTPEHGSVAEEIAALAEALRARGVNGARQWTAGTGPDGEADPAHDGIHTCEICPVCRLIAALHTVSPAAVTAMADLAGQAEGVLRTLAADLQARESAASGAARSTREDIPVDDLGSD